MVGYILKKNYGSIVTGKFRNYMLRISSATDMHPLTGTRSEDAPGARESLPHAVPAGRAGLRRGAGNGGGKTALLPTFRPCGTGNGGGMNTDSTNIPSLTGRGAYRGGASCVRRLKPTVNQAPSLRDCSWRERESIPYPQAKAYG
jgi:hypothetical protein